LLLRTNFMSNLPNNSNKCLICSGPIEMSFSVSVNVCTKCRALYQIPDHNYDNKQEHRDIKKFEYGGTFLQLFTVFHYNPQSNNVRYNQVADDIKSFLNSGDVQKPCTITFEFGFAYTTTNPPVFLPPNGEYTYNRLFCKFKISNL